MLTTLSLNYMRLADKNGDNHSLCQLSAQQSCRPRRLGIFQAHTINEVVDGGYR